MKHAIPLVIVFWAAIVTVVVTNAACARIGRRLHLARHRYLTRKHGQMLKRALSGGETR